MFRFLVFLLVTGFFLPMGLALPSHPQSLNSQITKTEKDRLYYQIEAFNQSTDGQYGLRLQKDIQSTSDLDLIYNELRVFENNMTPSSALSNIDFSQLDCIPCGTDGDDGSGDDCPACRY